MDRDDWWKATSFHNSWKFAQSLNLWTSNSIQLSALLNVIFKRKSRISSSQTWFPISCNSFRSTLARQRIAANT